MWCWINVELMLMCLLGIIVGVEGDGNDLGVEDDDVI